MNDKTEKSLKSCVLTSVYEISSPVIDFSSNKDVTFGNAAIRDLHNFEILV